MKKIVIIILMLTLCFGNIVFAIEDEVEVTLANAVITINGTKIDNSKEAYPFIVYKDITYFPMTWNFAKAMGLSTSWSQETGLVINKTGDGEAVELTPTANNNLSLSYNASIATSNIVVEGKEIDNSTEEFPLLVFQNITYFPMTWRFMVTEFETEYVWDAETGLGIRSSEEIVEEIPLEESTEIEEETVKELTENEIIANEILLFDEIPEAAIRIPSDGSGFRFSNSLLPESMNDLTYACAVSELWLAEYGSIQGIYDNRASNIEEQYNRFGRLFTGEVEAGTVILIFDSKGELIGQKIYSIQPKTSNDFYVVSFNAGHNTIKDFDSAMKYRDDHPGEDLYQKGVDFEIYTVLDGVEVVAMGDSYGGGSGSYEGEFFYHNDAKPLYAPEGKSSFRVEIINPDMYLIGTVSISHY